MIEYAAPVYNSLITVKQSDELERLQKKCLKIIYGWNAHYSECLSMAGITTLAERQASLFEKFTLKTAKILDSKAGFQDTVHTLIRLEDRCPSTKTDQKLNE